MNSHSDPADDILLARAHLSRAAESDPQVLAALVARVGPVEASNMVRCGEVALSVANVPSAREAQDRAHQDLELITARGGRLITPEHAEWPHRAFAKPADAGNGETGEGEPLALWVRGPHHLPDAVDNAVAVIGSRAASAYGEHVASEFGYGLAQQGMTVVSSAGYGIDGAAHRGAQQAKGIAVAVLPCAADVAYPAGQHGLLSRIARDGLIVSQHPPGITPARHRFITKNRLIAALSAGTVVVEAGLRSGARNAAAITVELGRVLMAVPGPITSSTSLGCLELIRDGHATPVGSVAHIVESMQNT